MKAVAPDIIPQVIMMPEIHRRAPSFIIIMLLGTIQRQSVMKKALSPQPKSVAVKCRSLFISRAAKPTFTRSM